MSVRTDSMVAKLTCIVAQQDMVMEWKKNWTGSHRMSMI